MAQGAYDHPSYLTRQMIGLGVTTAGAGGTSGIRTFPSAMRLRNVAATVRTAGTSGTTGNKTDIYVGTSSVGTIALGTSTVGAQGTSGDLNTTIAAGTKVFIVNGTDASGVADLVAEMHLDPAGTWS